MLYHPLSIVSFIVRNKWLGTWSQLQATETEHRGYHGGVCEQHARTLSLSPAVWNPLRHKHCPRNWTTLEHCAGHGCAVTSVLSHAQGCWKKLPPPSSTFRMDFTPYFSAYSSNSILSMHIWAFGIDLLQQKSLYPKVGEDAVGILASTIYSRRLCIQRWGNMVQVQAGALGVQCGSANIPAYREAL